MDKESGASSISLKSTAKGEIYFDMKIYWKEDDTPIDAVNRLKETFNHMLNEFPTSITAREFKKSME